MALEPSTEKRVPPATTATTETPKAAAKAAAPTPTATPETPKVAEPAQSQKPIDPRAAFNQGLAKLNQGALDEAGPLFETARTQAKADGEVRFRATYNLGWIETKRADAVLNEKPQDALQALQRAATWLREAVSLRPSHEDSRHNLEVVLKRAMVLADRLATSKTEELLARLNKTTEAQRGFIEQLRGALDLAEAKKDPNAAERSRQIFRTLSARQLELLAEGEDLSQQAGRELENIKGKDAKERTPEEGIKANQLGNLLDYLHRSRERMGQARSQMRRIQAERAFRRASAALTELKRAREQLLDLPTRLDALLTDGLELAQVTGMKSAVDQGVAGLGQTQAPLWLTFGYMQELQQAIQERTQEFHQGVLAGLASAPPPKPDEKATTPKPDDKATAQTDVKLREKLQKADPLLKQAEAAFATALGALNAEKVADAIKPQNEALTKLAAVRELFLDLKGLIELAWRDENRIATLLKAPDKEAKEKRNIVENLPSSLELQGTNLERAQRLADQIVDALATAQKTGKDPTTSTQANPNSPPGAQPAKSEEAQAEQKNNLARLSEANKLQMRLFLQMDASRQKLEKLLEPSQAASIGETELEPVRGSVALAVETLAALRQLFFSVIEHLKETLRREVALGDATKEILTLAETRKPEETEKATGPLVPRQEQLALTTGSIGSALKKQAEALSKTPAPTQDKATAATEDVQKTHIEPLQKAAEAVYGAQGKMNEVANLLANKPPKLTGAKEAEDAASASLQQALDLLLPPEPKSEPQGDQSPDAEKNTAEKGETKQPQLKPNADANQLLQGVRDREAKRRDKQGQNQHMNYEPVAKDW